MSRIDVKTEDVDISVLSVDLVKELEDFSKYSRSEDKEEILKIAKLALLDIEFEEDFLLAMDFLQCQVEHQKNQRTLVSAIRNQGNFREDFGDLRYMVRELQDNIMDALKYGKRTQRIDDMLIKLSSLIAIANQNPGAQSTVSLANAEGALSPRCSSCVPQCRSAHRQVQTMVVKLSRSLAKAKKTNKK